MPDMSPNKHPMPSQDAAVRARNFNEVALGYDRETAIAEAKRCLNCKNKPCTGGCPVGVDIPAFIACVAEGDFEGAAAVIRRDNLLPAVCGRVCPQETQCESRCIRGIKGEPVAIGRLERFVADYCAANGSAAVEKPKKNGHKAAIIGSGPAGLACAASLAAAGCEVTVFEALHAAGGVLVYGIPEFRLPKSIVGREVANLEAMGVEFRMNSVIGKLLSVDELFALGYESVFIGTGAGLPRFMGIAGENLNGVFSANEFLTRTNLMKAYRSDSATPIFHGRRVAVVGGGNVAMDAARCAMRLGAEKVFIVYRRSAEELPARREEAEHAREEGIEFNLLTNPIRIEGNAGAVCGMTCIKMVLGEPDASGRRSPVELAGSEFLLECDCVIMAIGTSPNPLIKLTTPGLETKSRGGIVVSDDCQTSREGVFAGGDAVTGAATVILAMGAGKSAAASMLKYMEKADK